jgi:hypothetical protein
MSNMGATVREGQDKDDDSQFYIEETRFNYRQSPIILRMISIISVSFFK